MSFRRLSHCVITRASSSLHVTATPVIPMFCNERLIIDAPSFEFASQASCAPASASASDERKCLTCASSKNQNTARQYEDSIIDGVDVGAPARVKQRLCNVLYSVSFRQQLFAQSDDVRQIEVVPFD